MVQTIPRREARWPRVPLWLPAMVGVVSVCGLLAPWAGSGRVDRSTVGVLSSASALDSWDGYEEWLALATWCLLPVLAAAAVVASAWGRSRFSAWCVVPIGPLMMLAWLAVAWSPFEVRWGAWVSSGTGLTATAFAGLVLLQPMELAEGTTR